MKRFLITFLAVIAAQVVLFFLFLVCITSILGVAMMGKVGGVADVPEHAYLIQKIPTELPEFVPSSAFPIPRKATSHTEILENLEKARVDDRIQGVVLKIEMPQVGWGKLQELRERIHRLRDSGKEVFAYATFATNKAIYLASACDSIFVHPQGYLFISGFNAERFYARQLLDRLGIETQISQIKEYKAVAEMLLRKDMSAEVRENTTWVLEDIYEDFLDTLARDRGVDRERVKGWLEICQFDAPEAVEHGIIDGALFWEEVEERLRGEWDDDWSIDGRDYAEIPRAKLGLKGKKIAVVHGTGTITQGESGWVFPFGGSMGDETVIGALHAAVEDDAVKAILLRLDTGGGMSTASDRIGRVVAEVGREKPIVVSMVDIAASGGYMVSYRCSTLVALPGSIVGSIGSMSMMGNLTHAFEKIGITVDRVTVGPHATALSGFASLTEEEFERFHSLHWKGYGQWVEGVARHRGLTVEEVDALARGRVFTGRQAWEKGLIDTTGSFDVALGLLKEQAGIDAGEEVSFIHLPRQKSFLERLAAGEVGSALHAALGRSGEAESLDQTVKFWRRCLDSEDALALFWWRF